MPPGEKWAEMDAALHGGLGTILEWAGSGKGKRATDTPQRGVSVSVVAGAGFEPAACQSLSLTVTSTSTVIPFGSEPMPTAERAPRPASSPNTSTMRSANPLMTRG